MIDLLTIPAGPLALTPAWPGRKLQPNAGRADAAPRAKMGRSVAQQAIVRDGSAPTLMAAPQDGDDAEMRARLAKLSTSLDGQRLPNAAPPDPKGPSGRGMGEAVNLGMRVMTEFVAAVLVGGVIGWTIDHWAGTSPAALIVFVGLGTAAGFWSVYRLATKSSGPLGR